MEQTVAINEDCLRFELPPDLHQELSDMFPEMPISEAASLCLSHGLSVIQSE